MTSGTLDHSANAEACPIAINIARNAGYAVFPCHADKSPACPHGFKQANSDAGAIAELWRHGLGPLIGIATGAASSFGLPGLDIKHEAAGEWWRTNHHRSPSTIQCLDHRPHAPWQAWLLAELLPKPEPSRGIVTSPSNADTTIEGLLCSVERMREGAADSVSSIWRFEIERCPENATGRSGS
jgi:hypothetical protein